MITIQATVDNDEMLELRDIIELVYGRQPYIKHVILLSVTPDNCTCLVQDDAGICSPIVKGRSWREVREQIAQL